MLTWYDPSCVIKSCAVQGIGLIELRRRLQREYFEDIFGAEEIKLFQKDISSLMNASVGEPPVRGRPCKHTYSIKFGLVSN